MIVPDNRMHFTKSLPHDVSWGMMWNFKVGCRKSGRATETQRKVENSLLQWHDQQNE